MFFDGQEIKSPYPCNPKDNEKWCTYQYNITQYDGTNPAEQATFQRPCKCSMDGDTGFCETILGTQEFKEGAAAIKNLFSSNLCHTLDRGDYRAMREECCLANEDEWQNAAEWNFKINNWANINAEDLTVKECFYRLDKMSPENLAKDQATPHLAILQAAILLYSTLILTTVF